MRIRLGTLLAVGTLVLPALAAGLPPGSHISGHYIEARNADVYTGPCFANSEVDLVGDLAVMAWRIEKGTFRGVPLDGLAVVAAVKAKGTLGDFTRERIPARAVLIVDSRATLDQRHALREFARRAGAAAFQDIERVEFAPIEFELRGGDVHAATASLRAGTLAEIRTRALGQGDHICGNEQTWYSPLAETTHAMPAYALANRYRGGGLGTVWSSPDKRSAFVADFEFSE